MLDKSYPRIGLPDPDWNFNARDIRTLTDPFQLALHYYCARTEVSKLTSQGRCRLVHRARKGAVCVCPSSPSAAKATPGR